MKTKLLFVIFFFLPVAAFAQQENQIKQQENLTKQRFKSNEKRLMLRYYLGTTVDMSGSDSNPNAALMGERRNLGIMSKYRFDYFFTKKLGWYGEAQVNIYHSRRSQRENELILSDGIIEGFFESLGDGIKGFFKFVHPSATTGVVYCFEQGRWNILPEIGVGYGLYMYNRNRTKSITDQAGIEHVYSFKQRAQSIFMDAGVSVNYYFTPSFYLSLHSSIRQPLQKSYAQLIHKIDDVEVDKLYYESNRIGRSLNLSLGFGFSF